MAKEAPEAQAASPTTTAPDPPDAAPQAQPPRWKRALGWVARQPLKAAIVLGASAASVGGVAVLLMVLLGRGSASPPPPSLDAALAALDRGAYAEARALAESLREQGDLPPNEWGGPLFVLGAAAAFEARETWAKDRGAQYLVAAGYLEEARARGFPPARRPEGLYLLAESLFRSGQMPAARPVLLEALAENPQQKTSIHDMLASAYFEDANPKLPEALRHNAAFLADKFLPEADRTHGLLRQAEIELRMGDLAACRATLSRVPAGAPGAAGVAVVQGQVLMHEAEKAEKSEARGGYEEAVKLFRQAQGQDAPGARAMRRAQYLIGVCFRAMGDYRAAASQFERVRATFAGTPEGVAAAFQEAEMARALGAEQEAIAAYRRALRTVGDPKGFSNPWVSLDDLRARTLGVYQDYLNRGDYGVALQLAQGLSPLFPQAKKGLLVAETYERWGRALAAKAEALPYGQRRPLVRQARAHLRQAGRAYQELAKLETATRQYTDHLWSSAENYFAGQDYEDAVAVLKEYLKNETRARHSLALAKLGESQLALGRPDEALASLQDCVDFHPRDAAAFRARLLASRAWVEKGDLDKAAELLQDNLDGVLSPSSLEWRQSLFEMGRLLHLRGDYQGAIARLGEAVRRYPDAPEAVEARYLLADSLRRSAGAIQDQLRASQVRQVRLTRTKEVQESLAKALEEYQRIQAALGEKQQNGALTPEEKAILRNTLFAVGDVHFGQGKYEEAAQCYTTAAYRYQSEPASLVAYLQTAAAYGRLNKAAAARNALLQAKAVLARLPPDAAFTTSTPFSRQEWEQILDRRLAEL